MIKSIASGLALGTTYARLAGIVCFHKIKVDKGENNTEFRPPGAEREEYRMQLETSDRLKSNSLQNY